MADKKIYPRTYAEILAAKLESEGIKVSTNMKKTFQDSFEKVISDIRPDLEISPEFIANGHYSEDYTESFDIAQRDIDKALNNVEEDLDELN